MTPRCTVPPLPRALLLLMALPAAAPAPSAPAGSAGALAAAPVTAAIFPAELADTSLEGEMRGRTPEEQARLHRLDTQLRELLAGTGRYRPVELGEAARSAATRVLHDCGGCDAPLAQQAGAQVSVVAWVQKVSALILSINAVIRDAATGRVLRAASVDIRGDTDESWSRGLAYLVNRRLLPEKAATP